jgi:hypothetical protein
MRIIGKTACAVKPKQLIIQDTIETESIYDFMLFFSLNNVNDSLFTGI